MDLNVIIGANGAGKSNLVDFFRMLSWMINSPGNLQHYIGMKGGANSFLHEGAAKTLQIGINLTISTDTGTNEYEARLSHAAGDTLIFAEEKCRFSRIEIGAPGPWVSLEVGHKESHLFTSEHQTVKVVHNLLRGIKVHQFHDTSDTARVKTRWAVEDCRNLKEDGGNLAPFLSNLIVSTILL